MDSLHSAVRSSRVPTPRTTLIGRDREVESVCALLSSPDVPLVTLTGPGGVGKTRLAFQIASEASAQIPHGSHLISLAPLRDPTLLLASIGQAFGIPAGSPAQFTHHLRSALDGRSILLVLDNFEHLTGAAGTVADLLAQVPELKLLITSRSPLHIGAEREFAVAPLALPNTDRIQRPYDYFQSAAVRLFVDRAQAVSHDFALTEVDAFSVARICRRLDGLPLAIELVAVHAKLLSPAEMLERLERRLPLLSGGRRDLPARQQTMTSAIAWSYDLLSPKQKACFEQLSVFAGGFTLDAAEAVVGPGDSGGVILDLISALIDESLLYPLAIPGDSSRFMMLETIREFAEEQLANRGTTDQVMARFAAWCGSFVHAASAAITPTVQPGGLERIEPERANIRATLDWLIAAGHGESATILLGDLDWYWYLDGSIQEGYNRLTQVLALDTRGAPTTSCCAVYLNAGHLAIELGNPAGVAWLEQSRALARRVGDVLYEARATYTLGAVAADAGNYVAAEAMLTSARALFGQLPHAWLQMLADYQLGVVAVGRGDHECATALLEFVIEQAEQSNDALLPVWCLQYLGLVAFDLEHHDWLDDIVRRLFSRSATSPSVRHHYWDQLAAAATLAADRRDAPATARLLGALAAESLGVGYRLPERDFFNRFESASRQRLGDDTYDREFALGGRMSRIHLEAEIEDLLVSARPTSPAKSVSEAVLTPRELEVLRWLVAGHTNREIADQLFISHRTVSTHVTNIFTKFDVGTRAAAVSYAFQHELL